MSVRRRGTGSPDPPKTWRAPPAERIAALPADGGIDALVIGASARAAQRYVRHTEDIDLGVNVTIRDLVTVAEGLRKAGYEVAVREPDGQDPPGGVIDVSGPFGLVQIVNLGERFPGRDRQRPC